MRLETFLSERFLSPSLVSVSCSSRGAELTVKGFTLSVAIWSVRKNLYSAVTICSFSLFLFFLPPLYLYLTPRLVSLMVSRPPASLLLPPKLKGLSLMSCLSLRRARLSFQTSLEALLLCPAFFRGSLISWYCSVCVCVSVCASRQTCRKSSFLGDVFASTKEIWTTSEIKSHV